MRIDYAPPSYSVTMRYTASYRLTHLLTEEIRVDLEVKKQRLRSIGEEVGVYHSFFQRFPGSFGISTTTGISLFP